MTPAARRSFGLLLTAGAMAFLAVVLFLYRQIREESVREETRPAQAIVVFGAAEYAGHPSPVLKARLDHALMLYRRGLARLIVTTGGPGGDPHFTEAGVGRNFLVEQGVPPENILVEDQSATTDQTVFLVAEVLARNRLNTCIVVSDGYHMFRIKRQFAAREITAYGSPRPSPNEASAWIFLRQVFGYMLWRVGIRM